MRCNLFNVGADGAETLEFKTELATFLRDNEFPDDEAAAIKRNMRGAGRYWFGGGAAPLMVLRRVGT